MLVCATTTLIAHETAGASGARHSLRPHFAEGGNFLADLGRSAPRECGIVSQPLLRGALATKQSILSLCDEDGLLRFARNDGFQVVIARDGGRSSIPPKFAIDPRGRGVLDTRMRGV
jgi:hypothetical protein